MHHVAEQGQAAELERRDDPLLLWRAISATHVIATTGIPYFDAQKVYGGYANIRQGADESVLKYKERVGLAMRAMGAFQLACCSS